MFSVHSNVVLLYGTDCYETIITIQPQPQPEDPIYIHTKTINTRPLSMFEYASNNSCESTQKKCVYALTHPTTKKPFYMYQSTECIQLILSLGYTIDYNLSKIMRHHQSNNAQTIMFYIVKKE